MQNKIFDICGTLYNSNTTMDFCEFRSTYLKKRLLKLSKSLFGKLINKILVKSISYDWIRIIHIRTLKGLDKISIEKDAEIFVEQFLNNRKIEEVHEYLNKFDKKEVILVSATIEPVAKAIAKKLGDLNYFSTTLNYSKNICEGTIEDDLLGNKQHYFKNQEIEFIITDNKSDLDLCKMAKEVVIVSKRKNLVFWQNQDLKLQKIIEV
ncbi:HAD family hydrolase [Aliarcobacter butzleri]|uniref:HAD family hydrolase n=1 Tax=Aliarcobacter butzleri TaxID=28197 RepID=UPI00263C6E1B|nr:HAD family hydrolase [Aliarcobacter butzleri]MDN5093705.1 HAD family hydrolase [Aliarcobacter butzleri]